MSQYMVELNGVVKAFDEHIAVNNVSLNVRRGEFLTLLGPSGCGKTTTLRMIAGFEQNTAGEIRVDSQNMDSKPPHQRDVNTVFQNYALFPHMNIEENVSFGLKMKKMKKREMHEKVTEALKLVQLESFRTRKPDQLSGGQKQRVAIARAIVNNPKVLLLDEPLGALDLKLRKQMQIELKHLQQKLGITFIYVTHDQEEALTMSDRIAVMNNGFLEQVGTSKEIYEHPKTKFVAGFIGESNLFDGTVISTDGEEAIAEIEGKKLPIKRTDNLKAGEHVFLTVRPETCRIGKKEEPEKGFLIGEFVEYIYVGSLIKTVLRLPTGKEVFINESPTNFTPLQSGEKVPIIWDFQKAEVLQE